MAPSSAINQSLSSLLPTQKPPAPLLHLSESLLAQSRQRAAHLKPEEEIARAHACCEIACNRLRSKCRLPAPKSGGAPCKPGVYRKLVAFLERVLDEDGGGNGQGTTTGTPKSTPGGRKRTADGSIKKAPTEREEPVTPSKSKSTGLGGSFLGKIKRLTDKNGKGGNEDGEAPSYTMPSIRKLCRTFSTPLLAPHVFTGTCVVLKLDGLWPPDEDDLQADKEPFRDTVTGLLIALYLMTLTRMQAAAKMTTSVYKSTCSRAVEVLAYGPGVKGVEGCIRRINRQGYCTGQGWWSSVPEKVFEFDPNAADAENGGDEEDVEELDEEEEEDQDDDLILSGTRRRKIKHGARGGARELEERDDPEGVLLPGLHTMIRNAVDYLNEERTREFEKWKKQFLARLDGLDELPAVKAGKAMTVK